MSITSLISAWLCAILRVRLEIWECGDGLSGLLREAISADSDNMTGYMGR